MILSPVVKMREKWTNHLEFQFFFFETKTMFFLSKAAAAILQLR